MTIEGSKGEGSLWSYKVT